MQTTRAQDNTMSRTTHQKGKPIQHVITQNGSEGKFSSLHGTQIALEYSLTNDRMLIKKVIMDESEKKRLEYHLFTSGVAKAAVVYAKDAVSNK